MNDPVTGQCKIKPEPESRREEDSAVYSAGNNLGSSTGDLKGPSEIKSEPAAISCTSNPFKVIESEAAKDPLIDANKEGEVTIKKEPDDSTENQTKNCEAAEDPTVDVTCTAEQASYGDFLDVQIAEGNNSVGFVGHFLNLVRDRGSHTKGRRLSEKCKNIEARYSDVPFDYSKYKCSICDYTGEVCQLKQHVIRKHKLKVSDFKKTYGDHTVLDYVRHECKICKMDICYAPHTLAKHLTVHHQMSINVYVAEHLGGRSKCKNPVRYSDLPKDYCRFRCQLCDFVCDYRHRILRDHVKNSHNLSVSDYKKTYGDPAENDKVRHKCKICQKDMVYRSNNLNHHLAFHHQTTIPDYIVNYLSQ